MATSPGLRTIAESPMRTKVVVGRVGTTDTRPMTRVIPPTLRIKQLEVTPG